MDIKCLQCGKDIYGVTKARIFCSQKCADVHRYIPKGRKKGKWLKCAYCGKNVWVRPWRIKKFKFFFCSIKHHILFLKKDAFRKTCIVCGKIFYCQPCQVKYRNRETCSIKCRIKRQIEKAKINRQKNGFTKHQIDRCIRYSVETEKWRKAVFARDNYTCQICGIKGGYLEADHIKPFAYFHKLRFELSNGRTLCRKCHDKTKISAKEMRKLYANFQTET